MKVCFYITSMAGGGAEGVFLNFINYLAQKGIPVELVLNRREGPYLEYLNSSVNIYELDASHAKDSIGELSAYLSKNKPDVAISTLSHCNYALILGQVFCHANPKILVREANSFLTQRSHLSIITLLYERIRAGILYRLADGIIVNSNGSKNELIKATYLKEDKIEVLPNPIDYENIQKQALKDIPEKIVGFLKGNPYIVAVGRLEKAKGYDLLIKSFSKLNEDRYRLIILGEGSERNTLEKMVDRLGLAHKVLMPGFIDNPYPVMQNADLFVLSSRYEGMPNVLLEALALELPIVATDCPSGPRELLENGKFGELVSVDDETELTVAMKSQLKRNISKKESMQEHIRRFTIDNLGSDFFSLLKNVMDKRG